MVDGELFDKLARIGSIMRKRTEPFGGIQVGYFSGYIPPYSPMYANGKACVLTACGHWRLFPAPACQQREQTDEIRFRGATVEPGRRAKAHVDKGVQAEGPRFAPFILQDPRRLIDLIHTSFQTSLTC